MDVDRLVREPERREITGYGPTQWRVLEREGKAPRRRQIGPRAVGWLLRELIEWVNSRPAVPGGQFSEPGTETTFSHPTATKGQSSAATDKHQDLLGSSGNRAISRDSTA